MTVPRARSHSKLVDDDTKREGYLLNQKAHNYVRQLQLNHVMAQVIKGKNVKPLTNQLLLPDKHPQLTWPVYIGEKGEAIAIYTKGKLGQGSFGGVYVGVNLDTGEGRAIKIQFPKSEKILSGVRAEESVLETLGRFDDRIEIQNSPLANDVAQFINAQSREVLYASLEELYSALATLNIITGQEFKALLEGDTSKMSQALIEKINNQYPEDFQQFKQDFLNAGASDYLLSMEKNLSYFTKNTTPDEFQETLAKQLTVFQESLAEQMIEANQFMAIGSQHLAWGKNLLEYLEHEHSDLEKLDVAIQMLEKLDALHQPHGEKAPNGFVHRDVKAANMMWDDESQTLTIVDMGYTRAMDSAHQFSEAGLLGTPAALAPELIIKMLKGGDPVYSPQTEMYAAGIVMLELYSMLQVEIPFKAMQGYEKGALEQAEAVKALLESNPTLSGLPPVLQESVSDVLTDEVEEPLKSIYNTIKRMLDINPMHRATFSEAILQLKQVRARLAGEQEFVQQTTPLVEIANQQGAGVPVKSPESVQMKAVLYDAIKSMRVALSEIEPPPQAASRSERKTYLRQAPSAKQKQIVEYNYWLRQLQALWLQDKIEPKDLKSLIKDIKVQLKTNDTGKAAVNAQLTHLKTLLKR